MMPSEAVFVILLAALTQSWLTLLFVPTNRELNPSRVPVLLGTIYAGPVARVRGLARHRTWRSVLGGGAGHVLAALFGQAP